MRWLPRTRRETLWRCALAAVIVIGASATITAVAGLLQFKTLADEIGLSPALTNADTTIPNPGNPQTILIVGSDHRAGTPYTSANTDTMMLVRLDPKSSTINVLSIPRDLRVQLPSGDGMVPDKLNAAYSLGGPNLLVNTLATQVFPGFSVNHIVDINFGGFEDLVDAIGCVYSDVDHRYYNNTQVTDYSSIDLQPGYQKLCDSNALAFVRFRHTDNDLVRNARQQDFIRWAKDQYPASEILANRDKLLTIFGEHAQTDPDLASVDGLINLFGLVAFSAGHTIKQVQFPATGIPCTIAAAPGVQACLTSTAQGEATAYEQFMTPTTASTAKSGAASGGHGGSSSASSSSSSSSSSGASSASGGASSGPAVIQDSSDGQAQAAALGHLGMPIYYPSQIASGTQYCLSAASNCIDNGNPASVYVGAYPRAYEIHDQAGNAHAAYRMTLVGDASAGQYYGVQGTTWLNPPILDNPSEKRVVNGKQLLLYTNGGKLTQVAWKTPQAAYWISNTLTSSLSDAQMIAIAASLTRA